MSIVFMDGFDYYDRTATGTLTRKWNSVNAGTNFTAVNPGPYGGIGIQLSGSSAALNKVVPASVTYGVGFHFRAATMSAGDILRFQETTTVHVALATNVSGNLIVKRNTTVLATSTNAMSTNTWYHIEIKMLINDTTGTIEVKVNGTSVNWINISSQDTRNAGAVGTCDTIVFVNSSGGQYNLDDVIMWNNLASPNNDFLGVRRVATLLADADGSTNAWTPNAGTRFSRVSEVTTDDDTTYISSAGAGNVQLFSYADAAFGTINAIQANIVNRRDDANAYTLIEQCKMASTTYDGPTTITPGASYVNNREIRETAPDGSGAWTNTTLNAAEFGVKQVT